MEFLDSIPVWALALAIFSLRIIDVSLGTIRTISIVQGRARFAMTLGFFEVLVWVVAIAQVVHRIDGHPLLAPAYAGGYAAGVAIGMLIERKPSAGRYLIRILSHTRAAEVAAAVGDRGRVLGTFPGSTPAGPASLVFVSAIGRRVADIVAAVREADPELFYTVEMAMGWSENVHPPGRMDWETHLKRK